MGGTGFIGYHLQKMFEERLGYHSLLQISLQKKIFKNVKYIICDISIKRSLKNKLKDKYNYVVNLGGYVDHSNIKKTYQSHFLGCKI